MKKYTLEIIYNEITGELESLHETVTSKGEKNIPILATPHVMEAIDKANLIEDLLVPYPGAVVGES
tara:strand:+ start:29951 stop:30148 length:198 start_codon:yes stop_codon:yes gene_type:complete